MHSGRPREIQRDGRREEGNTCSTASACNTPRRSMLQEKLNNLGHTANMMVERPSNRPLDIATVTVNNLEKLEQLTVRKMNTGVGRKKIWAYLFKVILL